MSLIIQISLIAVALILLVGITVRLGHITSNSKMYDFRNVVIASFHPFLLIFIVSTVYDIISGNEFSVSKLLLNFPAQFANFSIALIAVMGIFMAVSNVVLIRREGMALKNTVGTALQLIWLFATLVVYQMVCMLKAGFPDATGFGGFMCRWVPYFLYCLIDYGECIMIGMMIMGWVAACGKSTYDKDFIIIPGCSISKTGGLLPLLRGRVNRAIKYAWEQEIATGKPVHYIPSGGKGADEIMSEGSAMEMYLISHSAEEDEVTPEKESRNTEENFTCSAKIINEQNPNAIVAFSTTNYHVLRCGMLAKKAGLNAQGLASKTKWYFWPNGFAREVVAIANMTKIYHVTAVALIFVVSIVVTLLL